MFWRRTLVAAAILAAVGLGLYSIPEAAVAAPRTPAHPEVVFSPPQEGSKLTLGETSIAGPAFWAQPGATPQVILGWTGTDGAHRLNVLTSSDGFHYGAKRTLPETSPHQPAVTFSSGGRAGFVVVAWTGTDAAHTVNVEYLDADTLNPVRKLTFWGNTSDFAPGVAVYGGGNLALAWVNGQVLNVMRISPQGEVLGQGRFEELYAATEAPSLTFDPGTGQLLMSYIEPARFYSPLLFSTSTDAEHWTAARVIDEYSGFAATMVGIRATNMPTHWLAWTGTAGDTAHHLNVQYTERFPDWTNVNSKTTFGETDLGAPALGYIGQPQQMLVAWTGTDAAHHLNVAVVYVRN